MKGDTIKRFNNLYAKIVDYENLYIAYQNAAKGKRFRDEVLMFSRNLEENLINLQNHLMYKTYEVGRYREFYVYEPKKRLIMALPFKDRVVQWAVYQILEPLLSKRFIKDSYACQKGKGVQVAADQLQNWMRKINRTYYKPYYLKLDISKYFYRIDHDVLIEILSRKIKDKELMWLLNKIIRCETHKFGVPLGDHGFKEERIDGIGMPIGNLTSQLFANLYLSELDHYAKHELRIKRYIRYMDDIIVLDDNKKSLRAILEDIDAYVTHILKLKLNNKTCIRPISTGVEFVGYRLWTTHRKLRKSSVKKMKSRLKYLQRAFSRGEVDPETIHNTVSSYLGYMQHANCHHLKKKILKEFVLKKE